MDQIFILYKHLSLVPYGVGVREPA